MPRGVRNPAQKSGCADYHLLKEAAGGGECAELRSNTSNPCGSAQAKLSTLKNLDKSGEGWPVLHEVCATVSTGCVQIQFSLKDFGEDCN